MIGAVLLFIVAVMYSLSAQFKIPYYTILYKGIFAFRAIHISVIFAGIAVLLVVSALIFKKKRKIIQITLVITSFAYAILLMFLIKANVNRRITEDSIVEQIGVEGQSNEFDGIEYCGFYQNNSQIRISLNNPDLKKEKYYVEIVVIPDDYINDMRNYKGEYVLHRFNERQGYIDISNLGDIYSDLNELEHIEVYTVINNKIFYTGTLYDNNLLSRMFARGDRRERYDALAAQDLFVIYILLLSFMLISITFETV